MNSLRRVLAVMGVVTLLLAGVFPFLGQSDAASLTLDILVTSAVVDTVSLLYIARIVYTDTDRPRSWLLLLLLTTTAFTTIGLDLAVFVLLTPVGALPTGLGRMLVGMGVVLIGAAPPMKAAVFLLVHGDTDALKH